MHCIAGKGKRYTGNGQSERGVKGNGCIGENRFLDQPPTMEMSECVIMVPQELSLYCTTTLFTFFFMH